MIVLNTNILSVLEQLAKGADVIKKCTGNTLVSNITTELTAFVGSQATFKAASEAYDSAKSECKAKLAARNAAQSAWKADLKALGNKIDTETEGEPEAVLSTGLDLKAEPSPAQELDAPTNLRVATNGTPGKTKISVDPLPGAVLYIIEQSPDPITAESWDEVAKTTKPKCMLEGAEPGKKSWFRVAAVNSLGQGPWSDPVARPVM